MIMILHQYQHVLVKEDCIFYIFIYILRFLNISQEGKDDLEDLVEMYL